VLANGAASGSETAANGVNEKHGVKAAQKETIGWRGNGVASYAAARAAKSSGNNVEAANIRRRWRQMKSIERKAHGVASAASRHQ
jgi:hypothetical protein